MIFRPDPIAVAVVVLALLAAPLAAQIQMPSGTVLWLDADDVTTIFDESGLNPGDLGFSGEAQEWHDKSPSGYIVVSGVGSGKGGTDTTPEYVTGVQNGRSALRFAASDGLEQSPLPSAATGPGLATGNDARHVFFAGIPTANASACCHKGVNAYFVYGGATGVGTWNNMFIFDGDDNDSYGNYFSGRNNDIDLSGNDIYDLTSLPGAPTIIEFSYDGETGSFYRDGSLDGSRTLAEGPLNTGTSYLRVGREPDQNSDWDQLELIVYHGVLDEGARNQVGAYLADKWNITAAYVAGPPPHRFSWNVDGPGNWEDSGHWTPSFNHADPVGGPGSNQEVTFGTVITSNTTVWKDSPVTVRGITFASANNYNIAGLGVITLDQGTAVNAAINVVGNHQFQSAVSINSPTDILVNGGSRLEFVNGLNLNGNTVTKTGAGTLIISNTLNTGGGTLLNTSGVLAGSGTVGGDVNNSGGIVSPGNLSGNAPGQVPEPGSWALAVIAVLATAGLLRQRQE